MRCRTFVLTLIAASLAGCGAPPDAKLISVFQKNRSTFEMLRSKACAFGSYQTVSASYVDPNLSTADVVWFKDQMNKVGIESLNAHGLGSSCWLSLTSWSTGFAGTPADYKGYHWGALDLHDSTMNTKIVQSLDRPILGPNNVTLDRSLGRGWWLEYISFP